ncbi:MAG: putative quinol monooxygenase [Anaerolineaceae bacterium]
MYTALVSVHVMSESISEFIEITKYNAQNSRKEAGVVRFDFFQEIDHPENFRLIEIYRSKDALSAHQQTPHFLKWKEVVAPMMASERTRVFLTNLDPTDEEWY